MNISLIFHTEKLTLSFVLSGNFKLGHEEDVNNFPNYKTKTIVGAIGFGFLTIYYSRIISY